MSRVVIVTGASGGLGSAIARRFGSEGDKVVVHYNTSREDAERTAKDINAGPGEAFLYQADVSNYEEAKTMVEETEKRWGRVDVLANVAGAITYGGKVGGTLITELEKDEWEWVIRTNLASSIWSIKAVAPQMMKQREGSIIQVGAGIGHYGRIGNAAFAAAKAGLVGLIRSVARELGEYNIKVNLVTPGPVPHPRVAEHFRAGETAHGLLRRDQTPEEFAFFIVSVSQLQNVSGQIYIVENRIIN